MYRSQTFECKVLAVRIIAQVGQHLATRCQHINLQSIWDHPMQLRSSGLTSNSGCFLAVEHRPDWLVHNRSGSFQVLTRIFPYYNILCCLQMTQHCKWRDHKCRHWLQCLIKKKINTKSPVLRFYLQRHSERFTFTMLYFAHSTSAYLAVVCCCCLHCVDAFLENAR